MFNPSQNIFMNGGISLAAQNSIYCTLEKENFREWSTSTQCHRRRIELAVILIYRRRVNKKFL